MKKCCIAVFVVLAFAITALVGTAIAQDTKSGKVPDTFDIKDPGFKKFKKAPVKFTHQEHSVKFKLACTQCHHVYKDGKNVFKDGDKVEKCSKCHTSPKKNQGKMLSLYNAYHKNCRDCHKEAKKGPTKCNQCHPKK
ncbi:MAG: cytochrome c family protein [Desulfarculaceae bacterium]|nr:cytochrome c family protein [Desulfarculaceae bacterium]